MLHTEHERKGVQTVKRADGIFFDLGGTLRQSRRDTAFQNAAKRELHALVQPEMEPEPFFNLLTTRFSIYKSWAVNTQREADDELLWSVFLLPEIEKERIKAECHRLTDLFCKTKGLRTTAAHAGDVLKTLKARGYRLGILSNLIGEDCELKEWLQAEGLTDVFDTIVVSSVCGLRKPGEAIYRLACEKMGLKPERCASVADDLETDFLGAWKAGIGVNVLYHSPQSRFGVPITDANRPDYEIRDFIELLRIFV